MGKAIYFTDDQLIEIEQALIGHSDGAHEESIPTIDAVYFKIGLALERPWAKKQEARQQDNKS